MDPRADWFTGGWKHDGIHNFVVIKVCSFYCGWCRWSIDDFCSSFYLRVGTAIDDDLIIVMSRLLVRRCQTQFLWQMAPHDDGDDIFLNLVGWRWWDGWWKLHPPIHWLNLLPWLSYFFVDAGRCWAQILWQLAPRCIGNAGGYCSELGWVEVVGWMVNNPSTHPLIKSAPLALVFFCGRRPLLRTNFYGGWRRAALVMLVDIVLNLVGWGWWDGWWTIHPPIH